MPQGESSLIYTWLATTVPAGSTAPTFSTANGTNAGKSTIVTFSKAGAYTFRVTIQYPGGFSVTSSVNATVGQSLTSVLVSPTSINIANGAAAVIQCRSAGSNQRTGEPTTGIRLVGRRQRHWGVDRRRNRVLHRPDGNRRQRFGESHGTTVSGSTR